MCMEMVRILFSLVRIGWREYHYYVYQSYSYIIIESSNGSNSKHNSIHLRFNLLRRSPCCCWLPFTNLNGSPILFIFIVFFSPSLDCHINANCWWLYSNWSVCKMDFSDAFIFDGIKSQIAMAMANNSLWIMVTELGVRTDNVIWGRDSVWQGRWINLLTKLNLHKLWINKCIMWGCCCGFGHQKWIINIIYQLFRSNWTALIDRVQRTPTHSVYATDIVGKLLDSFISLITRCPTPIFARHIISACFSAYNWYQWNISEWKKGDPIELIIQ